MSLDRWHLGKGRKIEGEKPLIHETVKVRSSNPELEYTPKAHWEAGTETYVR